MDTVSTLSPAANGVRTVPAVVAVYLFAVISLLTGVVYALWSGTPSADPGLDQVRLPFGAAVTLSKAAVQLLLVLALGALGSTLHAVTCFTAFRGTSQFGDQWLSWYLFRPLVGMSTALVFYFASGPGSAPADSRQLGVLTMAGLVGLFSDTATLKLKEMAEVLFSPSPGAGGESAGRGRETSAE